MWGQGDLIQVMWEMMLVPHPDPLYRATLQNALRAGCCLLFWRLAQAGEAPGWKCW